MMFQRAVIVASLLGAFLISAPAEALALFDLSVAPRRGGRSIRFETAEPGGLLRNEEVTLTITTDRNAQYYLLQTLYQPLTNEVGNTIPAGAFVQFSPSNALGTLRTQLETPISMGQKQIYTSNSAGSSDEFVLVFNVRVPENQPGGVYHTQLTFSAELVNAQGGVPPSVTTLDVRVELTPKFSVTILNSKGNKIIDLGRITTEKSRSTDVLTLRIESNIGSRYRIFQQLTDVPLSAEGAWVEDNTLMFTASGASQGSLSAQGIAEPVPQSATLLYQSTDWGGGDQIQLQYFVDPSSTLKAGVYSGSVSFRLESSSPFVPNEVITVPIKMTIETIFSLETQFETSSGLSFGTFRLGDDKQQKKAVLKVRSNLGLPYQITQVVPRKMTNEQGSEIPADHFQFIAQDAKTGTLSAAAWTSVKEGETLIFTSDENGTPEQLTLNYSLAVPRDARAGAYRTELKYSITTL